VAPLSNRIASLLSYHCPSLRSPRSAQTLWIPIASVARLEIAGGSRHAFELQVELHADEPAANPFAAAAAAGGKAKVSKPKLHEFMIGREVEPKVLQFISEVHNKAKKEQPEATAAVATAVDPGEGSEDDASDASDDDSDEEMAAEGEYDSEADGDFEAKDDTDSCDEEYDSNADSSDEAGDDGAVNSQSAGASA